MSINSPEFMEQAAMIQFVKIIERYPDIYDHNPETHRRWATDKAWEKVVETVKAEMNMECTVRELKSKWKGIRSSYNRYRNKINEEKRKGIESSKKYYLHDALQFLEPFTKPKGFVKREVTQDVFQDCDNIEEDEQESTSETDSKWIDIMIKADPSDTIGETNETDWGSDTADQDAFEKMNDNEIHDQNVNKKGKQIKTEKREVGEENENLHFFRSILPDIAHFTAKEKRKFKIGVLKLIDDIENQTQKKKRKSRTDSSSSQST